MNMRHLTQQLKRLGGRLTVIVAAAAALALGAGRGEAQTRPAMCPQLVRTALNATQDICRGTGRNQICYGHSLLEAEPQPAVEDLAFEKQGDVVDAQLMRALRLSAMNINNGYWGVALMRLQANLPDTLPGQNVTFLLFGDVEVTSATAPRRTVNAVAGQTLTVRTGPSSSSLPLTYLQAGQAVIATGRLANSSWLRVRIPGNEFRDGWVVTSLLTPALGNFDNLDIVDPSVTPPRYGPLQAFYLKTGVNAPECAEMPTSGLLIQTPAGAHDVSLVINDVEVSLGSTVFVRAAPGQSMSVMTLEGMARLTAQGTQQVAAPGAVVEIPLDDMLHASGPPSPSEPYDDQMARLLPISALDFDFEAPPPLSREDTDRINELVARRARLCGVPGLPPCSDTTIAGIVTAKSANSLTINGVRIRFHPSDPILDEVEVGDYVSIQGTTAQNGTVTPVEVTELPPPLLSAGSNGNSSSSSGGNANSSDGGTGSGTGGDDSSNSSGNSGFNGNGPDGLGPPGQRDDEPVTRGNSGMGAGNGTGNSGMGMGSGMG